MASQAVRRSPLNQAICRVGKRRLIPDAQNKTMMEDFGNGRSRI
jgi:hypothetical protein